MNTLVLLLPGTPITYYGEEIGMLDNIGKMGVMSDKRDPCRSPMQWNKSPHAGTHIFRIPLTQYESNIPDCFLGFTNGDSTWLPVNESYNVINVEDQLLDKTSPLETYKAVVQIRRCHEDLILWGTTSFFSQVSIQYLIWISAQFSKTICESAYRVKATRQ